MRRALSFLTPFGGASEASPEALAWFPAVGALIGAAVGTTWWIADHAWNAPAAAAVAVAADVIATGYLHLDGLADSADGLIAPMPRERRLQVMADPATGAFGAVTLFVVILLRFGAFVSTSPAPLVVAGLWCASRTAMAVIAKTLPYVRGDGLASAFLSDRTPSHTPSRKRGLTPGPTAIALTGGALSVALCVAGRGIHGLVALVAEATAISAVAALARRRIGGFTGDVLGAAGVAGETIGLLALAAR